MSKPRPIWVVEFLAKDGQWFPVIPQFWYDFKYQAANEVEHRKLEKHMNYDAKYRPAKYVRTESR